MMNDWQLLNDLRHPDGRLIYAAPRGYYVAPAARWVQPAAVTALLAGGLIEQSGETAGVYRLSAAGRARWAETPPASIYGCCDGCGRSANLAATVTPDGGVFLCEGCVAHQVEPALLAAPSPRPSDRPRGRQPWTCDRCGSVTFNLTVGGDGTLCPACYREARHVQ